MNQKVIAGLILTALIASFAVYQSSPSTTVEQTVNALDMTCGFTEDFASFLSKNGKTRKI